ncbi:anaerobic dehydrogenase [Pontibacter qinzhouensis]|uniref:Anaerobic dehydrogenase n=1 Tax=Pontibacter qinzhouensis TaxID=2603253 RepID=A0A5C8KFQ5_9BACT|nr:DUF6527 family protein [Pontibacter qinzhouensis]TXK52393.1 anaerobic dehydrogenase [Pontibacter qinzhouensis]
MKVLPIINDPGTYVFECPGCKCSHKIDSKWSYNGNPDKPTLSPSVLVRMDRPPHPEVKICHSFVKDGNIQFLSDCTHELAGQTVELPELE